MGPDSLSKATRSRQTFHLLRRFVEKDGSVQVTRLWKENYDFIADSKFTNDPKDKTVIRALHGPWDFDVHDTSQEVHLIIHMWIGLFYSRSTARFFQTDSSQEKDFTDVVPGGTAPSQVPSETKTRCPAHVALSTLPEPEVLDRHNVGKKEAKPLCLEPKILDLSMKTNLAVVDLTVTKESKQRIDSINPLVTQLECGLNKETISLSKPSTDVELKVYRDHVDSMMSDQASELDDDKDDDDDEEEERMTHDYDSKSTLLKDVPPYRKSLESDESYIILCEQAASVYIQQDNVLDTEGKSQVSDERSCDGEQITACHKTIECTNVNIMQQGKDNDSVNTVPDTGVKASGDTTNIVDPVEWNENEPQDKAQVAVCDCSGSKGGMREADPNRKDSLEAAKPEAVHVGKDSTNKDISEALLTVYVGNETEEAIEAVHNSEVPTDVVCDSRDDRHYKVQSEMQDEKETTDAVQPVENYGNDSIAEESDEGNSLGVGPPVQEILHNEKDSHKASRSAVHSENGSRVMTLAVKSFSKMYRDDDWSSSYEMQTEMHDRENTTDEALPVVDYKNYSGSKEPSVDCDRNTPLAHAPPEPEISPDEKDAEKATMSAVEGEYNSGINTLPVEGYGKLYKGKEPAILLDRKGFTDDALSIEQSRELLCSTTRVHPERQIEVTSKDKILPTHVFPVSYGNICNLGEFDTPICSRNALSEAETTGVEFNADICRESIVHEQEYMQVQNKSYMKAQVPQHSQNEKSEIVTGQLEIPQIAVGIPSEVITHTKGLYSQGDGAEEMQGQMVIPSVIEMDRKDITHTKVHNFQSTQKETTVSLVCDGENYFSSIKVIPEVKQRTESVSTCATPTVNEVPYGYIPIPDIYSAGSLAVCNVDAVNKSLSRCPTPTQDEPPDLFDDHHVCKTGLLLNSNKTNISSPDLSSGFAQCLNEPSHRLFPSSSNDNIQNNPEAAIGKNLSETLTDLCKKPITGSTPLNTAFFPKKLDYNSLTEMRLNTMEQDLYAHSSNDSIPDSYPKTQYPLTDKAAFFVPPDIKLTQDLRKISLKPENTSPASIERMPVTEQSITIVSGPTTASQDLKVHNFTEPDSYSQHPAMVVNPLKSEDIREKYNKKQRLLAVDPTSSVAFKGVLTNNPALSNTNAHPYNTPYVSEIRRKIASLQDYEYVDEVKNPAVDQDRIESSVKKSWISGKQHIRSKSRLNKTKLDFINSLQLYQEWEKREFDEVLDNSKPGTSSSVTIPSEESDRRLSSIEKSKQIWLSYGRDKKSGNQMNMAKTTKEEGSSVIKPCLVTVLDPRGNRATYESYPSLKHTASTHSWTVPNSNKKTSSSFLEFSKRWDDTHNPVESDLTQSSMNMETLIFSDKMNQLLKRKKKSSSGKYKRSRHQRSNFEERASTCGPAVTVKFSSLEEQQYHCEEHWEGLPPHTGEKMRVEMPERASMAENKMSKHLQKTSYTKDNEKTRGKVSDLVEESFKAYHAMMNEVCAGRKYQLRTNRLSREEANSNSLPKSPSSDKDFCGQMKKDMYASLHGNLNSVVRQPCKNKFRFYIMATSDNPFFKETKELLEAEGNIEVQPSQFCQGSDITLSPLHIILRNEDIAEHICKVPHLLELKKSQNVLFAGIDRPDDIINRTHQELFCKGGFVVFEGAALDSLSLSNMKQMSDLLEGLSKMGKWKWLLHYRDSRKLKENARCNAEAKGKKCFMDACQDAGMVEVLPYHDCDVISKDQPHYLHCLVRLQVQNISARLPVFITDTTADKEFANHGIFTMNISSFLLQSK
ncbi:hypothetical protein UPYG_G00271140 [Umbra pygmaea]|uniref:DUF3715 domain-containing protein n=1 Tax=Umbra pygmaea TaxID=75934 RepID=A0ABD0X1A4_UMBPY